MRETTANRDQPPPVAWVQQPATKSDKITAIKHVLPMPAAGNSSSTVHIAHSVDPDLEKARMDAQQSLLPLMQKEYAELKKKQQQQQQQQQQQDLLKYSPQMIHTNSPTTNNHHTPYQKSQR